MNRLHLKTVILTALLLTVTYLPAGVEAHGLDHAVTTDRAVIVTMTHDDGTPFSFESCEITPPAQGTPWQVGRTDRLGRIAFLPDRPGDWNVRVVSEDGHGADLTVSIDTGLLPGGGPSAGPSRFAKILTGVSVLFGAFGAASLYVSRRKS